MTRRELDQMLEKAVADAIGVPYQARAVKRARKPRLLGFRPVQAQHSTRELQSA